MKTLATFALLLAAVALLFAPRARAEFTPTRFTIVVEGKAAGQPVLLLPGLTSGRSVFDAEAALLAPTTHLYRFQLNGFDGQPAGANASGPILAATVEELHQYLTANHLRVFVIGHSMGGLLGLMLAQAHPEDVQKLLILDALPFYGLLLDPNATVADLEPQGKVMRDALAKQTPEAAAAMTAQTATMLCNDPAGRKIITAQSLASDRTVFANAMYEDLTTDVRPKLAAIKTTTVLLYPYDSTLQGPDPGKFDALYKRAYSTMPNITLHRIDNSRHFLQFDQPAQVHTQIQAFLK